MKTGTQVDLVFTESGLFPGQTGKKLSAKWDSVGDGAVRFVVTKGIPAGQSPMFIQINLNSSVFVGLIEKND